MDDSPDHSELTPADPRFGDELRPAPGRLVPPMPARGEPPAPRRRGSPWTILLALVLLFLVFGGLIMLSQGMLLPAVVIFGGLVFVSMFHYVVWGWWLSGAIHRQVQEEERDRQRSTDGQP